MNEGLSESGPEDAVLEGGVGRRTVKETLLVEDMNESQRDGAGGVM